MYEKKNQSSELNFQLEPKRPNLIIHLKLSHESILSPSCKGKETDSLFFSQAGGLEAANQLAEI